MKTPEQFAEEYIVSQKERQQANFRTNDRAEYEAYLAGYNAGVASCEEGVSKLVVKLGDRDETIKYMHSRINDLHLELLTRDAAVASSHEQIKELQKICHDLQSEIDYCHSCLESCDTGPV